MTLAPLGQIDAAEPRAAAPDAFACTSMSDPAARLACYDKAFSRGRTGSSDAGAEPPSSSKSVGASPVPAVPAASASVSAKSPAEERFGDNGQLRSDAEARRSLPSQLEANVKRVAPLPNGQYRLTLDNGQVWQTSEAAWAVVFNPDDKVTIYRLPLGGYQIARRGENRTLGVHRTQ